MNRKEAGQFDNTISIKLEGMEQRKKMTLTEFVTYVLLVAKSQTVEAKKRAAEMLRSLCIEHKATSTFGDIVIKNPSAVGVCALTYYAEVLDGSRVESASSWAAGWFSQQEHMLADDRSRLAAQTAALILSVNDRVRSIKP